MLVYWKLHLCWMIKTTFHPQKRHFTGSYFSVYQENVPSQHFFAKKLPSHPRKKSPPKASKASSTSKEEEAKSHLVTWGFNGIKPWFFHVMVEPTEVLVELKQVNKNNLNNQNKFMFFICNYLLLCVIICVYVLSLSLLLLFKCIHIFICFHIFLFFSMFFYAFI